MTATPPIQAKRVKTVESTDPSVPAFADGTVVGEVIVGIVLWADTATDVVAILIGVRLTAAAKGVITVAASFMGMVLLLVVMAK